MIDDANGLETRTGLPAELRLLVKKYPRQVWTRQLDIGGTGAFWLQRHAMFRQMGGLDRIIADYRIEPFERSGFRASLRTPAANPSW